MKPAKVIKTVKQNGLQIAVKAFADGRFGFDWIPPEGERVKVRKISVEDAEKRARELIGCAGAGKLDLLGIDPKEFAEFLQWKASRKPKALICDLVKSLLASKRGKGRSDKHLRDLKFTLEAFAEKFTGDIESVTREAVEKFLNDKKVSPRTWNNNLTRIISLFRFARRDGALGADMHPVEMIEPHKVTAKRETYSVDEFKALLKAAKGTDDLPFVVLGGFCGVRPEEIRPDLRSSKPALRWENIDWTRKVIDLPAEVSKTSQRRFIPLCDAAAEFLADYRDKKGECVAKCDVSKITRRLTKKSGVKWLSDGLRHSYASYRLAIINDMQALSLEMGNSIAMIRRHYLELKHTDEAVKWFAIRP